MARNFGGEFILADWQFWEQSTNISSTKTLQCAVIIIRNHSFHVYNGPAAGRASVIVGMEFTIDSCVRVYHVSKGLWTLEVGEELACQHNLNNVYPVAVQTDAGVVVGLLSRKIGSLFSVFASEWYGRSKLAHGPVKFPASSVSHFAMNIIMAQTFSTAKIIPPNVIISAIRQNIFPPKFPAILWTQHYCIKSEMHEYEYYELTNWIKHSWIKAVERWLKNRRPLHIQWGGLRKRKRKAAKHETHQHSVYCTLLGTHYSMCSNAQNKVYFVAITGQYLPIQKSITSPLQEWKDKRLASWPFAVPAEVHPHQGQLCISTKKVYISINIFLQWAC